MKTLKAWFQRKLAELDRAASRQATLNILGTLMKQTEEEMKKAPGEYSICFGRTDKGLAITLSLLPIDKIKNLNELPEDPTHGNAFQN